MGNNLFDDLDLLEVKSVSMLRHKEHNEIVVRNGIVRRVNEFVGFLPMTEVLTAGKVSNTSLKAYILAKHLSNLSQKDAGVTIPAQLAKDFGLTAPALLRGLKGLEQVGMIRLDCQRGRMPRITWL